MNIDTMKVAELRAELARHGQSTTGLLKRDLRRCLKQLYRQKALAAKEIAEEKKANTNQPYYTCIHVFTFFAFLAHLV